MSENRLDNNVQGGILSYIYPYLFGLLVIFIFLIILTLITTAVVYFSDIEEVYLRPLAILVSTIALFCGGFAFGRKKRKQGLLGGLIIGVLFMLILALIIIFTGGDLRLILNKIVYLILASTIGGICGVK